MDHGIGEGCGYMSVCDQESVWQFRTDPDERGCTVACGWG